MRDYGASEYSGHTIQLGPRLNYTSTCHRSSVTVQRMHMCPWDDLEHYYLVRFQEVLTPVRVSGVGTGGDTVRSPSN